MDYIVGFVEVVSRVFFDDGGFADALVTQKDHSELLRVLRRFGSDAHKCQAI